MGSENSRQLAIIASEITQMFREDQQAREMGQPDVTAAVDQKNRERLKEIIEQIGWPNTSKVGEGAAHAAWLLVQHADKDLPFQKYCLELMTAESSQEVSREDIAYLDDRIRVAEDQPQYYGTQWRVDPEKGYIPEEIADPERLDQRRADMDMGPFAEFSEHTQNMYKEFLLKQNPTKNV